MVRIFFKCSLFVQLSVTLKLIKQFIDLLAFLIFEIALWNVQLRLAL